MTMTTSQQSPKNSRSLLGYLFIGVVIVVVFGFVSQRAVDWVSQATDQSDDTSGRSWVEVYGAISGASYSFDGGPANQQVTHLVMTDGSEYQVLGHASPRLKPDEGQSSYSPDELLLVTGERPAKACLVQSSTVAAMKRAGHKDVPVRVTNGCFPLVTSKAP